MALVESEKHQMQVTHSLSEPRPPGIAFRKRSNNAKGPRSLVMRWLSRNVASDPSTNTNQVIIVTFVIFKTGKLQSPPPTSESPCARSSLVPKWSSADFY